MSEIASDVFLKHRHDLTVLIKAQDENFFSQFVPCKVVTLGAYGDCNTIQEKAEMILMKITSHLAAGDSDSFMILLKIMQHYGDGTCDKRAKCILNELDNHQQPLLSDSSVSKILDFSEYNNHYSAYLKLLSVMKLYFKQVDLSIIQEACITYIRGPDVIKFSNEAEFIAAIKSSEDVKNLFLVLADCDYCNWFDTHMLEIMVDVSEIDGAKQTIKNYKQYICTIRINEVFLNIPVCLINKTECATVEIKFNKNTSQLTVGDIKNFQHRLEYKTNSTSGGAKLRAIWTGCLQLLWFIPKHRAYQLYQNALISLQEFESFIYFEVENYPAIFSPKYSSTKTINPVFCSYYLFHKTKRLQDLLLQYMDSTQTLPAMHSHGLLTEDEKNIICKMSSSHQRNQLLLQHVMHLKSLPLLSFCQLLQQKQLELFEKVVEVIPGITMTSGNKMELVTDLQQVTMSTSNHYFDPSVVYTEFLYLTDKVRELLQSCDPEVLIETCRNLMASDVHKINLFSDEYVEKLSRFTSVQSLVWELTSYSTWSDHSVMRVLASSCEEAIDLVDKFDAMLDPFQPITSYDMPPFLRSNMIPYETSTHTLLAVSSAQKFKQPSLQPSLQFVYNTRLLLMDKCGITQHCFQLLAVRYNPTVIYWTIPKSIKNLISTQILEDERGEMEVSVYQQSAADDVTEYQKLFAVDSSDVKLQLQEKIYLLEVQLNQKNKELEKSKEENRHNIEKQDRLQNKLSKTEHMEEEFRNSAETLQKRYNELQEENKKISEEVEREFRMKTKGIQQRLDDHKKEIEDTIKQITPDVQDLLDSKPKAEVYSEVSSPSVVESVQQLEYDIDDLEKLTKHLRGAEQTKLKQMQVQFQEEIEELNSKLKVKNEELKKSKEDNRLLSKKIADTKEAKRPDVDGSSTEMYPVKYSLLGGGSYGEVHRVHYKDGLHAGKTFHARLLPGYPNISKEDLSKLLKHISTKCSSTASSFSHPNVERFIDTVRVSADGVPIIITELCSESLTSYLSHTSKPIYTDQQLKLCLDMAQGVHYLQSQSLVHRNLHGGNVMMTSDGNAKIADYLCPLLFNDIVGNSSGYVPPEVLQNKPHSNQSNVFTLGVLFLQVITRSLPRPSTDVNIQLEVERRKSDLDSVHSVHPLLSCIKQCLKDDEVARPQTQEVCDHINQLITRKNDPEMMAYKLLYTDEHPPIVSSLATKKHKLQCTPCQDLPAPMYWAYAVTKGMDVYVTGGNSRNGFPVENLLKFNLLKNQWIKLPPSGFHHSVPAIIEGRLSLIGGRKPSNKVAVNSVNTYNEDSGQWESHYPGMIQPRYRPAVVVHDDFVIVLGGKIKERKNTMTDSIEVMKIQDRTWSMLTTCLPAKMYDMPITVSQDQVWIVGYDDGGHRGNQVYAIPFANLVSLTVEKHPWKEMRRDTIYYKMSVVPQSNPLVVLGGDDKQNKTVSAVLAFDPDTTSWNEVDSLSGPRAHCAVAPISDRGILAIGGCTETKNLKACNSSCINTVELYYLK